MLRCYAYCECRRPGTRRRHRPASWPLRSAARRGPAPRFGALRHVNVRPCRRQQNAVSPCRPPRPAARQGWPAPRTATLSAATLTAVPASTPPDGSASRRTRARTTMAAAPAAPPAPATAAVVATGPAPASSSSILVSGVADSGRRRQNVGRNRVEWRHRWGGARQNRGRTAAETEEARQRAGWTTAEPRPNRGRRAADDDVI